MQSFRKLIASPLSRRSILSRCRRSMSTYDYDDDSMGKTALVVGSSGHLGSVMADYLSKQLNMKVLGADIDEPEDTSKTRLESFISMSTDETGPTIASMTRALVRGVSDSLDDEEEISAIICCNGGFLSDPSTSILTDEAMAEYDEVVNKMMQVNLFPTVAASSAANDFMSNDGLFVAIGATAALSPTPGMLGYGMSKTALHHLVQSLGETTGKAVTTRTRRQKARKLRKDSEYMDTLSVVGILPTTIDTPSNRKAMPHADVNEWTKAKDIAAEVGKWIENPPLRPHSGGLVKVHPVKSGGAKFTLVR